MISKELRQGLRAGHHSASWKSKLLRPPAWRIRPDALSDIAPGDADSDIASSSRSMNLVYLENILDDPSLNPTSNQQKRHLAWAQGEYMTQVRMLEAIYSRGRRSAAKSVAKTSDALPQQAMTSALSPPEQQAATNSSIKSPSLINNNKRPSEKSDKAALRIKYKIKKGEQDIKGMGPSSLPHYSAMRSDLFGASACEGAAESSAKGGVKFILDSMAAANGQNLVEVVKQASPVAANFAILALGNLGRWKDVSRLTHAVMAAGCSNEHTYGSTFSAFDNAGRFDMAIQYFEELHRKGFDLGPIGSSVLIKLCAHRRDLPLALDIFHRLHGQSTLNRFAYNCLIHLCGIMGQVDEALMVIQMMHQGGIQPDSYTFTAVLRAVSESKEWKVLPKIYKEAQRSQVKLEPDVWCMLIAIAGRASRPELAKKYYEDSKANGCTAKHIDNALLGALSRHLSLAEMLHLYQGMLANGLKPDEYTFNAILTNMSRGGASSHTVDDLVGEMAKWNVKVNTHLGTNLINAYKRSPEMVYQDPRLRAFIMEKAHDILSQLASERQANCHTYGTVMAMHAQLGDAPGIKRLFETMNATGVAPDAMTFMTLAKSCEDGGLMQLASQFKYQSLNCSKSEHARQPLRERQVKFKSNQRRL